MPRYPLLAAFALLAAPLLGQEVKIVGPVWGGPKPAPAVLPPLKGFNIDYPSDARKGKEIGYVLVHEIVAPDGKVASRLVMGNYAVFERAVRETYDWHIAPAVRESGPVQSDYRILVIFNPSAASAGGPDAAPRLLSAPTSLLTLNADRFEPDNASQTVDALLHLNEAGEVADVDVPPEFADLKEGFMHVLRLWRFAPARQGGQAVAATVALPLLVLPRPTPAKAKALAAAKPPPPHPTRLPVPIKQAMPSYPKEMLWSGLVGEVDIDFIVNAQGAVQDETVARSNNPGFEEAALEAVAKWKFKPAALADGTPVAAKMEVPIVFQLDPGRGADLMSFSKLFSKLPPELNYDVEPKATSVVFPVYPYDLLQQGTGGDAEVGYLITARGKIAHTAVISASRPEFGAALEASLAAGEFDPALRKGAPTATIVHLHYNFGVRATWIGPYSPTDEYELARRLQKHPEELVPANKVDGGIHPVAARSPVFPPNLLGRVSGGKAEIELVVDEEGKARLPRIVSASQPEFGYAAAQAVVAWRFTPPKVAGKPVLTRVQVPFLFR